MNQVDEKLLSGQPIVFSESEPETKRTLQVESIYGAVQKGVTLTVHNAIIRGPLLLKNIKIEQSLTFKSCIFMDHVDFSFSTFERHLDLEGCTFRFLVHFVGTELKFGINCTKATFEVPTVMEDLKVNGSFIANEAAFNNVFFNRSKINGLLSASKATFNGIVAFDGAEIEDTNFSRSCFYESQFIGTRIKGDLNLKNATFQQQAAFDAAKIEANAFFDNAIFKQVARFVGASVGKTFAARKSMFEKQAIFDNAKFYGGVFFNDTTIPDGQTTFKGEVRFNGAQVDWHLNAQQCIFMGALLLEGAQINGSVFLSGALFGNRVRLIGTTVTGDIYAEGAHFKGNADLHRLNIFGDARFEFARFEETAFFNNASFKSGFHIYGAAFKDVYFTGAAFDEVYFQPLDSIRHIADTPPPLTNPPEFQGSIELRGATFHRLYASDSFLTKFIQDLHKLLAAFERQPYVQIEQALRNIGKAQLADDCHFRGKLEEGKLIRFRKTPLDFLRDRIYRWALGYGVKPWRPTSFAIVAVATLCLGWIIFLGQDAIYSNPQLTTGEAFLVSLNFLVPGVEVIGMGALEPSKNNIVLPWLDCSVPLSYLCVANFERVIGWITIPITLLGLSGLFKPRS